MNKLEIQKLLIFRDVLVNITFSFFLFLRNGDSELELWFEPFLFASTNALLLHHSLIVLSMLKL